MPTPEELQQDKDFMSANPAEQVKYLRQTDPDFAKAHPDEQAAYLAHLTKQPMSGNEPEQKPEGFLKSFGSALGAPERASDIIEGPKYAIMHPYESAKMIGGSLLKSHSDTAKRGYQEIGQGKYGQGATDILYSGIPFVGPALSKAGHQLSEGDVSGGIGTTLGLAAPLAMGKLTPYGKVAPTSVHPEAMARGVGESISVPPTEFNSFVSSARKEAPAIVDYAKRSGISLKQPSVIKTVAQKLAGIPGESVPRNFANAARGSAESAHQFYKENVLAPYEKDTVPTTGTGFKGRNAGEGQSATLGEINQKIQDINDVLRPAYSKKTQGQTMTALSTAEREQLQAQEHGLRQILHDELAKRTGSTPEDIANLRQTFGRRYSIADQANAASNLRKYGESTSQTAGQSMPTGKAGLLGRGWIAAQGGPEAIAGRRLTKSLKPYGTGANYENATKPFERK